MFVCLMAMRTSLRKRNKKRLRLEKGHKGLGKKWKNKTKKVVKPIFSILRIFRSLF